MTHHYDFCSSVKLKTAKLKGSSIGISPVLTLLISKCLHETCTNITIPQNLHEELRLYVHKAMLHLYLN